MRLQRVETTDKKKVQYILSFDTIRIIRERAAQTNKTQSLYIADLVWAELNESLTVDSYKRS